jgi:hypothetical protein
MKAERSLRCPEGPVTGSRSDSDESNLHPRRVSLISILIVSYQLQDKVLLNTSVSSTRFKITAHVSMTTIVSLVMVREVTTVSCDNHTKPLDAYRWPNAELLKVKANGITFL